MCNRRILILLGVLFFLAMISSVGSRFYNTHFIHDAWYLDPKRGQSQQSDSPKWTVVFNFVWDFITFFLLYNNLVPISLTVTLEIIRFHQAVYINQVCRFVFVFQRVSGLL